MKPVAFSVAQVAVFTVTLVASSTGMPASQNPGRSQDPGAQPSPTPITGDQPGASFAERVQLPQGERYLFYDSGYGSLNNQINSLVSALTMAKSVNATTVIGPAFTPSGASRLYGDSKRELYLIGDFLDRKKIAANQKVILWSEFQTTHDAKILMKPGFSRYFYAREEEKYTTIPRFYHRILGIKPHLVKLNITKWGLDSGSSCKAIFNRPEMMMEQCGKEQHCRFIMLDKVFTNFYDCSAESLYWVEIRRNLIPVPEIRRTIYDFIASVKRPVVAAHVRFVGEVDGPGDSFYSKMAKGIDDAIEKIQSSHDLTIYVLGMKQKNEKFRVDTTIQHLATNWAKTHKNMTISFVTCGDMVNCGESEHMTEWAGLLSPSVTRHLFDPRSLVEDTNSHFSTILLEEWLAVMADAYVGRKQSTFSQSVGLWREHLFEKPPETSVYY